jgi:aspartate/methionine/tyrosine aminotransferase
MLWAKTRSHARFNLATSGVSAMPLRELGITLDDLEMAGPSWYGYEPLQEALARKAGVDRSCVVAAIGTSQANHLVMSALLEPGDEVLLERPIYDLIENLARHLGAEIRTFERRAEEGFRLDPEAVRQAVRPRTRLIALTNLHNPTGARATEEELRAVGAIAREIGAKVLVDEVYLEMLWVEGERGEPGTGPSRPSYHLGPEFVTTSSLTKAYGLNGLRCGWIVADPELARRCWRLSDLFTVIPAHAAERLSLLCLERLDRIADRAKAILQRNRILLDAFLDSRPDLEAFRPGVGTVVFPRWRGGSVEPLCDLLRDKYETTVVPGRFFGLSDHFRIGIGGDGAELQAGLERLGKALEEL